MSIYIGPPAHESGGGNVVPVAHHGLRYLAGS